MTNSLIDQITQEIEMAVHKAIAGMTSNRPPEYYRGDIKSALMKFAAEIKRSVIEP